MKLIYTFSKKLNHTGLDRVVEIYKKSLEINSKFHEIILYTDDESVDLLNDKFTNIEIIDTPDLLFFDDLKMKVLSKLKEDEILCDGDLFLKNKIYLDETFDVVCDSLFKIENTKHYEFYEYYRSTSRILVDNGIQNIIPFYDNNLNEVMNIGFLWFRKNEIKNLFLDFYILQKKWIIENKLNEKYQFTKDFKNTVTFSQYFLTLFSKEYKLNISPLNRYFDYIHYSGDIKFEEDFMNRFKDTTIKKIF